MGFFLFLLCVHATSNSGSSKSAARHRGSDAVVHPPAASALHKRLQQSIDGDYEKDDDEDDDRHGVQFIPGVPGHSSKKKIDIELQADEVEYLKSKNKELYESHARAQAAKTSKFVYRGDIQPSFDDNLECQQQDNNINAMNDAVDAPIYREFVNEQQQRGRDPDLPPYVPAKRLIHFDLKGAPPTVDYALKVLTLAKDLGATGVLMEYEDMFPFEGKLANVSAFNAYSKADVTRMLDKCRELELEVMPLVQTFGE